MQTETYKIKTANFEGPFGLLLNLVEERKLFINEISLAQVTEDFLKYINTLQLEKSLSASRRANEIFSFLVVAATLILIKSKSLLPNLNLTEKEEGDIRNLEYRLKLYEFYTRLSENIKSNFGKKIIFPAGERKNNFLVFLPDDQITANNMMAFAQNVLSKIPKKVFLPEVEVKRAVSIEEMIDKLTKRIQSSLKMNFRDFACMPAGRSDRTVTKEERIVVIIGFLAMLELMRQGILNAMQENNFEDIIIERRETIIN